MSWSLAQAKQASAMAREYGVKGLYYGGAGSGKTPMIMTAPRPILLAVENGVKSLHAAHNLPVCDAIDSLPRVFDFIRWLESSAEANNFDTIGFDSASYLCELMLREELSKKSSNGNKVDGKAAYGEMARRAYKPLYDVWALKKKHIYMICKQGTATVDGSEMTGPYFPGKDLYSTIPGLYDLIAQLTTAYIPGYGEQPVIRCRGMVTTLARDRTNKTAEFEPRDLTALFNKLMS